MYQGTKKCVNDFGILLLFPLQIFYYALPWKCWKDVNYCLSESASFRTYPTYKSDLGTYCRSSVSFTEKVRGETISGGS